MKSRWLVFVLLIGMWPVASLAREKVEFLRTPNGGIQPQAITDDQGAVHLIYFKGTREAGDLFYVPPEPHDSWVVGDEPYVSLHFLGAETYAK